MFTKKQCESSTLDHLKCSFILRSLLVWHHFLVSSNTCCMHRMHKKVVFLLHRTKLKQFRGDVKCPSIKITKEEEMTQFPQVIFHLCVYLEPERRRTDVAVKIKINCKRCSVGELKRWSRSTGKQAAGEGGEVGWEAHQGSRGTRGSDRQQN